MRRVSKVVSLSPPKSNSVSRMERTVVSSPQTANNLNIYTARLVVLSLEYTYKRVELIEKSEVSRNLNLCSVFVAV